LNHVALRMPTLVLLVSVDLDKLLEDGDPATNTFRREPRAVVEVADCTTRHTSDDASFGGKRERPPLTDFAVMFVVRVLRTKQHRTGRTLEVFDVVLLLASGNVASSERQST
jgi:hypothetical protein